jgi:hypothetical protein
MKERENGMKNMLIMNFNRWLEIGIKRIQLGLEINQKIKVYFFSSFSLTIKWSLNKNTNTIDN